jgi:hypothetical protein
MSVHAARALIGWRTSSGSCHIYCVGLWNRLRTMSLLGFVLKFLFYFTFILKSIYPEENRNELSSGYTMVLWRLLETFFAK